MEQNIYEMQLTQSEADHFFSLFKPLLIYTNQKFQASNFLNKPEDIEEYPFEETVKVRNKLYHNPKLFDKFIEDNEEKLSNEDIRIIKSWQKFLPGKFYLFRYLKKYTIFLTTDEPYKAYGVLSLYSSFQDIFGNELPRLLETVLLPFKGQIVSDGIFLGSNIYFGSGYSSSLKETYQEAKARFGIITSLEEPLEELETVDASRLKTYLKNERNRENYWYEIQSLKEKSPELKQIYYQEMGKAYAKKYSKTLREIGLKNVWFAWFEHVPIASGKTQADVERIVNQILPLKQRKFVYFFHLKGK